MLLVGWADEDAKSEVPRCRRNGKIIGRYHMPRLAQDREQLGPPFGNRGIEVHDSRRADERIDSGPPSRGAFAAARKRDADEELSVDDRRNRHRLAGVLPERRFPIGSRPIEGDQRAGVDYEAQGFLGARSAAPTRSRSSAKDSSESAAILQAAAASASDARVPAAGPIRAIGTLWRSMRKVSPP